MKLDAPAAERNRGPIVAALDPRLPPSGLLLEVASGSGRHAASFAERWPGLTIQPSEPTEEGRASIEARRTEIKRPNLRSPLALDVLQSPWPIRQADVVFCANMIHIAPWAATEALIRGASELLDPGQALFTYGPYHRGGRPTSEGNAHFDASLRRRNPAWGIRDLTDLEALGGAHQLPLVEPVPMPANNFLLVFRKTT